MPLSINPTSHDDDSYQRKLDILTQYTRLFQSYAKHKSDLKDNELLEIIDHTQEQVQYAVNSVFYTAHRNKINSYYISFFSRVSKYDTQALLRKMIVHLTKPEFESLKKKLANELSNSTVVAYQVNDSDAVYSNDEYQRSIQLADVAAQAAILEYIASSNVATNELIQTKSLTDMPFIKSNIISSFESSLFIASIKTLLI